MKRRVDEDRGADDFGPGGPGRRTEHTKGLLLAAARESLESSGYSGFSTRQVAERAGVPLSQIHYHFGGKQGLVLALLEEQNKQLLARQARTFGRDAPLSDRWDQACDHLDEDIASGYVRTLQEMIAAGWSDPEVAQAARAILQGWYDLLAEIAREAGERLGGLGPFTPEEVGGLVGMAFMGGEAMILLGVESDRVPVRRALRGFGEVLRRLEAAHPEP